MSSLAVQPFESRLLFISGDQSGVGKSSIAMGILAMLLKSGSYISSELAYIKPCTQCEDVQLVCKYCQINSIAHQSLGPIIFYQGYTQQCIDGTAPDTVNERHEKIKQAVTEISKGKKLVLVDGVGYPAVGSVCGVSNADVALLLQAPILVVGRPGIGNAIDSMNYIIAYFNTHSVTVLGGCWNKIPDDNNRTKHYVTKYYRQNKDYSHFSCYGFIPMTNDQKKYPADNAEVNNKGLSCRLKISETDMHLTEKEKLICDVIIESVEANFDLKMLLEDLERYYTTKFQCT
ncbi:unnamed protein product [Didymodactylos carnosus]|uniref:Uncharacterized protein n=1 Tax=Didymodactylos carnosus TaxID=1234261 RepID=A0A814QS77_9BILA|nr:unnamed protein product [Didymodactylos carnosus]CAF1122143.1 unnamed protein product [Didymodactylos carnosus]CAF3813264.1 unnamed protein product [Didymodactylos carnosus]CAF3885657.1 unnamed protein product [Didymodactylos carnosus]